MSYDYDDPYYDYPDDYYEEEKDMDHHDDPEQEDAANNHGLAGIYVDRACMGCNATVYTDGDGKCRNSVNGDLHTCIKEVTISMEDVLGQKNHAPCTACGKNIYESAGRWYDVHSGVAHTCNSVINEPQPSFAKERTMNNLKVISFPARGISADSLKLGEYARVVGGLGTRNLGDIVLKASAGVVNISDPASNFGPFGSPFVERLHTGDKLEITVGFTPEFEESIRSQAQSNKIMAIKAVREATNWGLKEAKEYVETLLKF